MRVNWKLALLSVPVLLLLGCTQKLTYERWQTIHEGDSPEAVHAILGEPLEKLDMRWMYMDADRGISADIYFESAKVTGKTWSDPDRGIVGKSPNVNKPGDSEHTRMQKIQ